MSSHVFCCASPGSGKTYYLLNNFQKLIFITFVRYTQLSDHVDAILNQKKTVKLVIADVEAKNLKAVKFPQKDVVIIDLSKYRHIGSSSKDVTDDKIAVEKFIIDTLNKNNKHYSTLTIDECQIVLGAGKKQSEKNYLLDELATLRNLGFRVILASQRPQAVTPQAVELSRAFICMKMIGRLAIKTMDEALRLNGVEDYIEMNKNLKVREIKEYVFS